MIELLSSSLRLHRPHKLFFRLAPVNNKPRYAFSACASNPTSINILYKPLEDIERLERYCPGGYHPVNVGDRFHSQYHVVDKLGYGSYSTTWLARDE